MSCAISVQMRMWSRRTFSRRSRTCSIDDEDVVDEEDEEKVSAGTTELSRPDGPAPPPVVINGAMEDAHVDAAKARI